MSSQKEQGFTHLLTLVLGLSGFLIISSIIPVNRHYNDGKSNVAGVYLAKGDDDSSGRSGENGLSGKSGPSEEDSEDDDSNKNNTSSPQLLRVETKTTPERIKSEIREGNLRVKFEVKDNKIKIETRVKEAEDEIELEDEAEDEAIDQVEAEFEDVKIATSPGQIALVNKRIGALSKFPLSVNPTTKQLTVTTPAGTKVVTVLPQAAIDNMLTSKVMDDVLSEKADSSLASIPDLVKLEVENGVLVYKVKGTKTHKLLGFIPIKTGVEASVSAENGQIVQSIDSLLGRILNRLAP